VLQDTASMFCLPVFECPLKCWFERCNTALLHYYWYCYLGHNVIPLKIQMTFWRLAPNSTVQPYGKTLEQFI
jgi:surface polysaccharide O-acyltransferase-like enzyme